MLSHVLLPPYVALDDGLHPLQQQLVDEGDIVHEAGSTVPSPGGQSYGPCSTHHSVEQQHVFIDSLSITQTRKATYLYLHQCLLYSTFKTHLSTRGESRRCGTTFEALGGWKVTSSAAVSGPGLSWIEQWIVW